MNGVQRWLARFACLLLMLAFGCSKSGDMPTAPVTGVIKYKGQPVTSGTVMFVPERGPAATGELGKAGRYSLTTYNPDDGAVLGIHKITITAVEDMGDRLPEDRSPLPKPVIPAKYLSHETSGLTFEVKESGNDASFELTE